jgi:hypothetical protein
VATAMGMLMSGFGSGSDFANQVVMAQRNRDVLLGQQLGATNASQSGDMMAAGYYDQARKLVAASNSDTASGGGQQFSRSGGGQAQGGHTFNISMNVHTPDVAGFSNSRQQMMQDMYQEMQQATIRNG